MVLEGKGGFNPYKDIEFTLCAIDYDGTIVDDNEEFIPVALEGLKALKNFNIKIILWSCRPNEYLEGVKERLRKEGIEIDYINDNCEPIKERYEVESRKVFAHLYFDDQAVGFRHTDWAEFVEVAIHYHRKRVSRGECPL